MILAALQKSLSRKARAWAKVEGFELPSALELAAPPAHVKADLSLPWPLAAAKAARKNPIEVARAMAAAFSGVLELEKAEPSPPGFVNLRLKNSALCANLRAITLSPESYGADPGVAPQKILLEFVSANPTGPLHVASGRGATLGDALARILRRIGHKVHAEYYVNNAGARVELLGLSLKARYDELQGRPAEIPSGGYQGEYLKDIAAALPAEASGWSAVQFGRHAMDTLLASHRKDMDDFGVSFDRWFLESELHEAKALDTVLEFLKSRGLVYEKDGAVWLGTAQAEGAEDDKDRVLVKSDGRPTYFLGDIAYHKNKFDRGFDELIDILGADHHGYTPRMKAAVAALGKPPESFRPIIHQLVHLFRGAEAVKMSKRAGTFVPLREVLDEAGRDACRFFFAMRTPDSHLHFDLELAKKQSSENPVYYCQYVHARICSIFREALKQGVLGGSAAPFPDGRQLELPEERAILLKLAWFPAALKACEKELSPHPLANYLMELANLFHPFYEKCRVVDSMNLELSQARLELCAGVRDVIVQGLGLLGVSAPEQM